MPFMIILKKEQKDLKDIRYILKPHLLGFRSIPKV